MSTLAVLAHYDPHGQLAPHARRHAEALATAVDRLVIVSTAALTPAARRQLADVGELLERDNAGYDFGSWQHGLAHAGDWTRLDRVVIANDSAVGPLRPMAEVLGDPGDGRAVRGVVRSDHHGPHLQSLLLAFGPALLRDPVFAGFWQGMVPLRRRAEVVLRYEVGLGRLLTAGGYRLDPYFRPSARDRGLVRVHGVRRAFGVATVSADPARVAFRAALRRPPNLLITAWSAALDGRLPYAKLETLRDDPARVGRERMLAALEQAHPAAFEGVRDYLARTRGAYQDLRAGDVRRERLKRANDLKLRRLEKTREEARRRRTVDRGALR